MAAWDVIGSGSMKRLALIVLAYIMCMGLSVLGQNPKPRVFITAFGTMNGAYRGDTGHVSGTYASSMAKGARPQTAEITKTFGERCPERWPSGTHLCLPSSSQG